ncbi:MAG: hypothetical protein IPH82_29905 [Chloroflexi bacterium]|nr:hypothetical protein [Chloroflexota bacterium]
MSKIYTPAEAAEIIGLTPRTIIKRCLDSRVPGARRTDNGWMIPAEAVEAERQRVAAKTNIKAPDTKTTSSQITLQTARPARAVNEYTAAIGSATEAELAANRARLAEIAKRARAAVYITADGRTKTVKRGKAGAR